jgi:hypothetical protein
MKKYVEGFASGVTAALLGYATGILTDTLFHVLFGLQTTAGRPY